MNASTPENREELDFTVIGRRSEMGRSTVDIECPFCKDVVTAYLWSLAGSGKRCTCGAKFGSTGKATR